MTKLLPAAYPPAKGYVDVQGAYACNEIAINWQAPLVFLLAGALK
jgi:endoglucanase